MSEIELRVTQYRAGRCNANYIGETEGGREIWAFIAHLPDLRPLTITIKVKPENVTDRLAQIAVSTERMWDAAHDDE